MKREFDMQLNYNQYRIIEKLLEAELEDYIFEEDFFELEHAIDLLVAYRQFRDTADDVLDEMMENRNEESNKCAQALEDVIYTCTTCNDNAETMVIYDKPVATCDDICCVTCADDEYKCNVHCQSECDHEELNKVTKYYEVEDERTLYEHVFNIFYPEGTVVVCGYDPNKILPGEWVESLDCEGYWKRIK